MPWISVTRVIKDNKVYCCVQIEHIKCFNKAQPDQDWTSIRFGAEDAIVVEETMDQIIEMIDNANSPTQNET